MTLPVPRPGQWPTWKFQGKSQSALILHIVAGLLLSRFELWKEGKLAYKMMLNRHGSADGEVRDMLLDKAMPSVLRLSLLFLLHNILTECVSAVTQPGGHHREGCDDTSECPSASPVDVAGDSSRNSDPVFMLLHCLCAGGDQGGGEGGGRGNTGSCRDISGIIAQRSQLFCEEKKRCGKSMLESDTSFY